MFKTMKRRPVAPTSSHGAASGANCPDSLSLGTPVGVFSVTLQDMPCKLSGMAFLAHGNLWADSSAPAMEEEGDACHAEKETGSVSQGNECEVRSLQALTVPL